MFRPFAVASVWLGLTLGGAGCGDVTRLSSAASSPGPKPGSAAVPVDNPAAAPAPVPASEGWVFTGIEGRDFAVDREGRVALTLYQGYVLLSADGTLLPVQPLTHVPYRLWQEGAVSAAGAHLLAWGSIYGAAAAERVDLVTGVADSIGSGTRQTGILSGALGEDGTAVYSRYESGRVTGYGSVHLVSADRRRAWSFESEEAYFPAATFDEREDIVVAATGTRHATVTGFIDVQLGTDGRPFLSVLKVRRDSTVLVHQAFSGLRATIQGLRAVGDRIALVGFLEGGRLTVGGDALEVVEGSASKAFVVALDANGVPLWVRHLEAVTDVWGTDELEVDVRADGTIGVLIRGCGVRLRAFDVDGAPRELDFGGASPEACPVKVEDFAFHPAGVALMGTYEGALVLNGKSHGHAEKPDGFVAVVPL